MGQMFTKIYSYAAREVKMYNIEKRAEKVISKEKPTPAPMYPSTIKELKRLSEENVSKEYLQIKDKQLDGYLKKVYVTTPNPVPSLQNPTDTSSNPDRPLPQSRFTDTAALYGYSESEERTVPVGQISLKQALQCIADHRTDPQKHSNTAIAAQYKLPITLTDDILEHYKMLNLHVNKNETDPEKLSTYKKLQLRVQQMNLFNAYEVMQEVTQVQKKSDVKNHQVEEIKEKREDNIDMDKNISDDKKDGKKKR